MRCHKARLKINSSEPFDLELLEHLKECPSCRKLASAGEILTGAFGSVRAERAEEPTPMSLIRAKVAIRASRKEQSVMSIFKNILTGHPKLGFGLLFGLVAVAFLVLVPLPYQRVAGYDIEFNGVEGLVAPDQLSKAFSAIGYDHLATKVMASETGTDYTFSNIASMSGVKEITAAFKTLSGTKADPTISTKFETVSASLYAQARNNMVKIEVDGTGKTDDQIKAEIESKLAAQGLNCPLVYIKTDRGDGQRKIQLSIQENGDCQGPPQQTIEIDGRGKTPDQLKNEIKSRLEAQGHDDVNVTIQDEGSDSLRKIEIEIKDTTGQ